MAGVVVHVTASKRDSSFDFSTLKKLISKPPRAPPRRSRPPEPRADRTLTGAISFKSGCWMQVLSSPENGFADFPAPLAHRLQPGPSAAKVADWFQQIAEGACLAPVELQEIQSKWQ